MHTEVGSADPFREDAWQLIQKGTDIAGSSAVATLCDAVSKNCNSSFFWSEIVELLQARQVKDAAPLILMGLLNRYDARRLRNTFRRDEVESAIGAIHVLDLPDLEKYLVQLLWVEDEFLKEMVIRALGSHGDNRALGPLKKRLGTFWRQEKSKSIRSSIEEAIKDIKRREH
jgi:hypothetical protein